MSALEVLVLVFAMIGAATTAAVAMATIAVHLRARGLARRPQLDSPVDVVGPIGSPAYLVSWHPRDRTYGSARRAVGGLKEARDA